MRKSYLVPVCVAVGLAIAEVRPADAAVLAWGLSFVSGGVEVGTGEFSYDTDKVVVVATTGVYLGGYVAGKDDPIREDYFPRFPWLPFIPGLETVRKYANPIEQFVAKLPGQDWTLTGLSWFDPSTPSVLEGIGCYRTLYCFISKQWFGGSSLGMAPGQFIMFDAQQLDDGRYTGKFYSAPVPSTQNSFVGGTWTATAVPEPTTIVGAVLAGVGVLTARRKTR